MKKNSGSKRAADDSQGGDPIAAYSQALTPALRAICDQLRELITVALPDAVCKVWHGSPVWFMEDNPIVGYSATAAAVDLLFWNGQAFGDPTLQPVGKYRAARAVFADPADLDPKVIRLWLKKANSDVFDSKAFFKKLRETRRNG
jgi:hypothetical protein